MPDVEKVIKAFEFCLMPSNREEIENDVCSHEDCPYYREYNGGKCISAAVSDALALLKAQEPIAAIPMDWMDAQIRGYASALQSTELKALIVVKGLWERDQEER